MKKITLYFIAITTLILFTIILYPIGLRDFPLSQPHVQKIVKNESLSRGENIPFNRPSCLGEDETFEFIFNKETRTIDVYINKKVNGLRSYAFTVSDVSNGYNIEQRECGFYVTRDFGFDYLYGKELDNFSVEIWQYQADGKGRKIVTLAEKTQSAKSSYYMYDYIIDESGSYITLEYPYIAENFIVIKNIQSGENLFSVTKEELVTKYNIDIHNPELMYIRESWSWTNGHFYFSVYPNSDSFRIDINSKILEKM